MIRSLLTNVNIHSMDTIRHTEQGMIVLVKDGTESPLDGNSVPEVNDLPPVRYILPYPNAAIQRSAGVYKNYYGYK